MSEGEVYSVEAILDRKKVKNRWTYLLKWVGYEEPTWESEKNLIGCESLIEDYLERHKLATPKRSPKDDTSRDRSARSKLDVTNPGASSVSSSKQRTRRFSKEPSSPSNSKQAAETKRTLDYSRNTPSHESQGERTDEQKADATAQSQLHPIMTARKIVHSEDFEFPGEPTDVVGAYMLKDELYLAVKCNGEPSTVTFFKSAVLRQKIPQLILDYYESRLKFNRSISDDSLGTKMLAARYTLDRLTGIHPVRNEDVLQILGVAPRVRRILAEVDALAAAKGIVLQTGVLFGLVSQVAHNTRLNQSSTFVDVLNKSQTEIEFMNGTIVRESQALGLSSPENASVYEEIKLVETSYADSLPQKE